MALTVVITYDVRQDHQRSRLSAYLQRFGDRIQKSVFLCLLEQDKLDELIAKSREMIDQDSDSVYVLTQCSLCWDHLITIGQAQPPEPELYWTVL